MSIKNTKIKKYAINHLKEVKLSHFVTHAYVTLFSLKNLVIKVIIHILYKIYTNCHLSHCPLYPTKK